MKKVKPKIKRFYLEKCGKPEKVFTGNKTPRPIKIKHVATMCVKPPLSNQCGAKPQAPQPQKKKEKKKKKKKSK